MRAWWLVWGLAGCAAAPEPPEAPRRPVCGWEELEPGMATLRVPKSGEAGDASGERLVLLVDDETPFAAVARALEPARRALVRIKVVIEGRYLLPVTNPSRQPAKPPQAQQHVTIVGAQRVIRDRALPRIRLAEIALAPGRVRLYVENERPAGRAIAPRRLGEVLRAVKPPVDTFMLRVDGATPWREVRAAIAAAACYDRGPDEEPHEIVLR